MARAVTVAVWLAAIVALLSPALDDSPLDRPVRLLLVVLLGAAVLWTVRAGRRSTESALADYIQRLERLATIDDLTGLANRRSFTLRLAQEFSRARRYHRPLSLVLLDLDGFKQVNDTHGHAAGDLALATFGPVLLRHIRSTDFAARLGGDEFAVLLPESDREAAARVVARLKESLADQPLVGRADTGRDVHLDVSAGVAELTPEIDNESRLLATADAALYAEKRAEASADRARLEPSLPR